MCFVKYLSYCLKYEKLKKKIGRMATVKVEWLQKGTKMWQDTLANLKCASLG